MKGQTAAAVKFGTFIVVSVTVLSVLVLIFGQLRWQPDTGYRAIFTNSSGLKAGDFVRIAGVEAGKVTSVGVYDNDLSLVTFSLYEGNTPSTSTRAIVRYANLIGDRYLELTQSGTPGADLARNGTIGTNHTAPALDLDALLGGFQPLFKTLDPDTVNTLSTQIVHLLQGEGGNVAQLFRRLATITGRLADRDQLIGQVITNVGTVVRSAANYRNSISNGIEQLDSLLKELASQADPIAAAVGHLSDAAASIGSLLADQQDPIRENIAQVNRVAQLINSDTEYLDGLLTRLPGDYRQLSRLGLYGDFFGFYLCDITVKVNGPDHGEPLYIDLAKQNAGRCTRS